MKDIQIKTEYIEDNDEEIVLRIRREHHGLEELIRQMLQTKKIQGLNGKETICFRWEEVYYFEYVDGKVFAYLENQVCTIPMSLEKIEQAAPPQNFFRCSKSMILNIQYVERFQSMVGNRIIATLSNNEKVIVSRLYAKQLKALLLDE